MLFILRTTLHAILLVDPDTKKDCPPNDSLVTVRINHCIYILYIEYSRGMRDVVYFDSDLRAGSWPWNLLTR